MPTPLSQDQVLRTISTAYHPVFRTVQKERVYSHENIFYAADYTTHNSGYYKSDYRLMWGFVILTDERRIEVRYSGNYGKDKAWYFGPQPTFLTLIRGAVSPSKNRAWVIPPAMLSEYVLKTQDIHEGGLWSNFIQNEHSVSYDGRQLQLLELHHPIAYAHAESTGTYNVFNATDGTHS